MLIKLKEIFLPNLNCTKKQVPIVLVIVIILYIKIFTWKRRSKRSKRK